LRQAKFAFVNGPLEGTCRTPRTYGPGGKRCDGCLDDVLADTSRYRRATATSCVQPFLPRGMSASRDDQPRRPLCRADLSRLCRLSCSARLRRAPYDLALLSRSRQRSFEGYNQPKSLSGFKATRADWANLDAASAVPDARALSQLLRSAMSAIPFGGQALACSPTPRFRALRSQHRPATWKLSEPRPSAKPPYRLYTMIDFLGVPSPCALRSAPGWTGIGEELPKDRYLQWNGVINSPRYMFDDTQAHTRRQFRNTMAQSARCIPHPWATRPQRTECARLPHRGQARHLT